MERKFTCEELSRMDFEQRLKSSNYFVEATRYEQELLKDKNPDKIFWWNDGCGYGKFVGYIGLGKTRPVGVQFNWSLIGTKLICFYEASHRFVDWDMIEKWITKSLPGAKMSEASKFRDWYNDCKK